ncbi:MAG: hypothetical protein ACYC4L_18430 [Chloroflexota bacterium]
MRRLLAILLCLSFLLPLLVVPAAAQEARTFTETGKTARGDFLAFFDANGGAEIFGAPITDELVENGRTVQYFAKARFEAWPENPPGYQVQLGLIALQMGKFQPAIADETAGDPNRLFFPETGHVLAFAFKDFWLARGGLNVFGYPTTEQLVENGVIVQYCQRARFEWRPENPAGQQVVLGDLGREHLGLAANAPVPAANQDVLLFHTGNGGDIYTVRADGSELRQVGHGLDPSWSPDRTKIVWASWDYPWGIYVADPDGQNARLVYEAQGIQSPTMSADGRYIAYTQKFQGYRDRIQLVEGRYRLVPTLVDLWRVAAVDVQSGQVHEVDAEQDFASSPTWSPDSRLAFGTARGIEVVNRVDREREVTHVVNTTPLFISPTWSPDGGTFASMWKQHDHWEISLISSAGSGFHLLTSSPPFERPANNVGPSWSPDGKSLAFFSDRNGRWQLFIMNADGSNQRALDLGGLELRYEFVRERPVSWGK